MNTKPIVGLEVHVELNTKSKMFCGCPAFHFDKEPNTQTCPVCLGLPGALPVPNQQAIEDTIKIGLALNCTINEHTHFDRKQYFYPDLAKGYQISQYDQPICKNGYVTLDSGKKIRILRVHLEEDTGKLQHTTLDGKKVTLVDFNRSGVPLVEIVSEPDMNSAEEAKEYLKKVHAIVKSTGVADADMEKGQMRLEPTVNVEIDGSHYTPLVEIKNINSFNYASLAIDYEVKRQVEDFVQTGVEKQGGNKTTRGYDSEKKITFPQRTKEEAKDYRYFPEPDIPPLILSQELVGKIKNTLPQMPDQKIKSLTDMGVDQKYAKILYNDQSVVDILFLAKDKEGIDVDKLANLIANKKIKVENDVWKQYQDLTKVGNTNEEELKVVIQKVVSENPKVVSDYNKGNTNVLGFFVGQVMRETSGQANAQVVSKLLLDILSRSQ